MIDRTNWRLKTREVRGGTERTGFAETSEALFLNSGYVYDDAEEAEAAFDGTRPRYVYSRYANPTLSVFERRLAAIEGVARCHGTGSGMAAVFAALMASVRAGDRVVASRALFGSCLYIVQDILPRFGVVTELVDGTDLAQWRAALATPAAAVFLETPSNPTLELIDLAAVAELSKAAGARLIVDNVFATPILQRPFELGADVVVYSATKHIDGQGRCLGGAVLTDDVTWADEQLLPFLRHTGPALSPFNAWVLLKGLETLDLRVERQCRTALGLARLLEGRPEIARVRYPGLESHPQHDLAKRQMTAGGTLIAFDLAGTGEAAKQAAFSFLNRLEVIDISNNLGDAKSLITHPATTTHQSLGAEKLAELGIGPGTVRLSVGLEDPDDLGEDLAQALAQALAG